MNLDALKSNDINNNSQVKSPKNQSGRDIAESLYHKGDIIEGTITKIADKVCVEFDNSKLYFEKNSLTNPRLGEVKKFKVIEISQNRIELQEVNNEQNNNPSQIFSTKIEGDLSTFTKVMEESQKKESEEEQKLAEDAERMSASDSKDLDSTGYDYRKYSLKRLEKVLTRIKQQRQFKQRGVEKQIENNKQFKEEIKEIAKGILNKSPYAEQIIERLEKSDLPITEANIENLIKGTNMAMQGIKRSTASNQFIIQNNQEITIGTLYKSLYSGFGGNHSMISDQDYQTIEKQVKSIIEEAGLEVNKETTNMSKWIISNDLPFTKENLLKLKQLNALDSSQTESVIDAVIEGISKGDSVEDIKLVRPVNNPQLIIKDFESISDQAIINACKNNNQDDITLQVLKLEQSKLNNTSNNEVSFTSIEEITSKRLLQEICLKMTAEAATKMAFKGISVDTTNLEGIVNELRGIERDYYKDLLSEAEVPFSDKNVSTLETTTNFVQSLKWMPSNLLASTFDSKNEITLTRLHETGNNLKNQYELANQKYETLMTQPRADMGDSIKTAFSNSMQDILDSFNLKDNEANRRAIRMLGYASLEITKDSIAEMKIYDEKVNYMLRNLTPEVTMDLIKKDRNPLMIPLDELNREIAFCKEINGFTNEEGYAKFLRKLEKHDNISDSERQAYIGIYRLLHNVNITDGAAISSLVKNNKELTLNNLLTEVRTRRTAHVDKEVDDNFGEIKDVTYKTAKITDQISQAFTNEVVGENASTVSYNKMLLEDILSEVTPSKLTKTITEKDWSNMTLEDLRDEVRASAPEEVEEKAYNEEQVQELRELARNCDKAIEFLVEFNEPVTIETIKQAQILMSAEPSFYQQIKNISHNQKKTRESLKQMDKNVEIDNRELEDVQNEISEVTSKESLQNNIHAYMKVAEEIVNQQIEEPNNGAENINYLNSLKGAIKLANNLARKEHYEIPITIKGEIVNISLTVVNKKVRNQSSIDIQLNSSSNNSINANIKFKKNQAKILVVAESKDICSKLEEKKASLHEQLTKKGIMVSTIDYGVVDVYHTDTKERFSSEVREGNKSTEEQLTTKQLYDVAETFIKQLKSLDI